MSLKQNQQGIAHLGLALLLLLVLSGVGFTAYRVTQSNDQVSAQEVADQALSDAGDDLGDNVPDSEDESSADDENITDASASETI